MKATAIVIAVVALCVWAASARADWDPQNPAPNTKWVQLPDPNGWDVRATSPNVLADDFLCTETGLITDVHLWGSWRGDAVGTFTNVRLAFLSDVPATDCDYSRPGDALWWIEFDPRQVPGFEVVPAGTGDQGWYDPATGDVIGSDHEGIWQVNIQLDQFLPADELFHQDAGNVYWLGLQVDVASEQGEADFGWKTSFEHWNDDAVWGVWEPSTRDSSSEDGNCFQWYELRDPRTCESLDLAFVLTGSSDTLVPEPGLLAAGGMGLLGLLMRRRRK